MKYVFLTFTMDGITGGPSYVNNKVKWLTDRGIETVVFDHYGSLKINREVVLENLLPFRANRMLELFFPPSYFSKRQRNAIIENLLHIIGYDEDYVIESNSPRLSLWGELLAKKLHAKHLLLLLGERMNIQSEDEFRYLEYKLNRRELFAIKPRTMQSLFEGYMQISNEEAQDLCFSASMGVKLEDVPMPELDDLPNADFRILSFGRYKPYFKNMIYGVVDFSRNHSTKSVNFLFMGNVALPKELERYLDSASNLFVKYIPSKRPIPKAVFEYSDVVIGTAGCANISFRSGFKTISMDVESNTPLGVMGYNTTDSIYSTNINATKYVLSDLLEDVLIEHLFDGEPVLNKAFSNKSYDYQLELINEDRKYWSNIQSIVYGNAMRRLVEIIVLRCGGIKLFTKS